MLQQLPRPRQVIQQNSLRSVATCSIRNDKEKLAGVDLPSLEDTIVVVDNYDSFTYNLCQVHLCR